VGEGNIFTNYLADVRLLSVWSLLTYMVAALQFSAKCNMARFCVQNGLVCCLRIKYQKL